MLGLTVDTCSASVLGSFGRIMHIFYGEVDSNSEACSLRSHTEWRSVLSRCFSFLVLVARTWEFGNHFHEVHVAGSMCDDGSVRRH